MGNAPSATKNSKRHQDDKLAEPDEGGWTPPKDRPAQRPRPGTVTGRAYRDAYLRWLRSPRLTYGRRSACGMYELASDEHAGPQTA